MTHPFPSFEVVPAVDMQDGQVVQLVGGERGT
ncbi:MAG: 1-(5-phosphoribosyl)-5-((5-phosphoribosylamino)methylideneamino)imidazole-4-carboxamide isomerase, partial [Thiohalorhabdaceae bacterium]